MKTYRIYSNHMVHVDDYNKGELDFIKSYDMNGTVKAEDPRQAIQKYFDEVLCLSCEVTSDGIFDGTFQYSNLVDEDDCEASESEIEEWKKGNKRLYSCTSTVEVYELVKIEDL